MTSHFTPKSQWVLYTQQRNRAITTGLAQYQQNVVKTKAKCVGTSIEGCKVVTDTDPREEEILQ